MKAVEYWGKKLQQKSQGTREEYLRRFNEFLEWAKVDSEQLYLMQREALRAEDLRESDVVYDLVEGYLLHMEKAGYSNSVCNQVVSSVKSFFNANKLDFDSKGLRRRPHHRGARRVRKEEILEIYRYCQRGQKYRNRALVMVAKDSGLRASDLAQLQVRQLVGGREVWRGDERFVVFEPFRTVKTGDIAHTILGPESVEAIETYLKKRGSGPFFLTRNGKEMDADAIISQFIRFNNALEGGDYGISAHSFRKFFKTSMESVMPEPWVKMLMGKAVGPYTRPLEEELVDSYIRGYDRLRVFSTGVGRREFESMKKEMEALKSMLIASLDRHKVREELEGGETIGE